jgi:predicted DNA-binding transcriptional regulator AlpA
MENIDKPRETVAQDMLLGAEEIAAFLGISIAQVYHYARLKRLPIGKIGKNLIASKRALQRAYTKLTG